jgi:hypothetical protein
VTKDDKTLELVQRTVAFLKTLAPPAGMSDATAVRAYYAIFDGPARWKKEIRNPQENLASAGKSNSRFKIRGRGTAFATTHMN